MSRLRAWAAAEQVERRLPSRSSGTPASGRPATRKGSTAPAGRRESVALRHEAMLNRRISEAPSSDGRISDRAPVRRPHRARNSCPCPAPAASCRLPHRPARSIGGSGRSSHRPRCAHRRPSFRPARSPGSRAEFEAEDIGRGEHLHRLAERLGDGAGSKHQTNGGSRYQAFAHETPHIPARTVAPARHCAKAAQPTLSARSRRSFAHCSSFSRIGPSRPAPFGLVEGLPLHPVGEVVLAGEAPLGVVVVGVALAVAERPSSAWSARCRMWGGGISEPVSCAARMAAPKAL